LLLEAGDSENASSAAALGQYLNLNSELNWSFYAEPKPISCRQGLASRAHAGNSLRGGLLASGYNVRLRQWLLSAANRRPASEIAEIFTIGRLLLPKSDGAHTIACARLHPEEWKNGRADRTRTVVY
jgi:hypothetical protein